MILLLSVMVGISLAFILLAFGLMFPGVFKKKSEAAQYGDNLRLIAAAEAEKIRNTAKK